MKRFKRIISSALAIVLTLTALVTVTNATQFTDVPSTAPLLDAINYAVDNNFIEPTSSTTFSPNGYMTRGNMVLMLSPFVKDSKQYEYGIYRRTLKLALCTRCQLGGCSRNHDRED